MIVKRNFNLLKVVEYIHFEFSFSLMIAILVYVLHKAGILPISLPFSIAAILGSALAIFIAFRNNSAYGRWWEARTHWSGIINASRVFARLIITFTDSHAHQPNYDHLRSASFKECLINLQIGWVHALRMQLRNQYSYMDLKPFIPQLSFEAFEQSHNKPNFIQLLMGKKIYEAMANGTLGGFDSFQLEGQLLALANHQSACERIKTTPLLRQYDFFTRLFLYVFIFLLPFTLMTDFIKMNMDFWVIPIATLISIVFSIIGKVGEVNEDPFENKITDVPLTALCNTVERDLKEMMGEYDLPAKAIVENGFLF